MTPCFRFDIVKTRLQTANFESKARSSTTAASSPTPLASSSSSSSQTNQIPAQKRLSIPSVFSQIYRDSVQSHRYRYHSTLPYTIFSGLFPPQRGGSDMVDGRPRPNPKAEKWTLRVLGLRGFAVGLRPTVVSSFVGSAATISTPSSPPSRRTLLEVPTLTRETFNSHCRSCATFDGCQRWRRSRLSLFRSHTTTRLFKMYLCPEKGAGGRQRRKVERISPFAILEYPTVLFSIDERRLTPSTILKLLKRMSLYRRLAGCSRRRTAIRTKTDASKTKPRVRFREARSEIPTVAFSLSNILD